MGATKQPADKSHFILPDLGEGVHEAELIQWRVKPGETVKEHQTLAEMETDKALVEVPSPWTGVIKELRGNEGEIITVGSVLVTYSVDGDAPAAPAPEPEIAEEPSAPAHAPAEVVVDVPLESASAEEGADADAGTVVGTVSGELEVSDRFARQPEHEPAQEREAGRSLATPAVRRVARELGVDISAIRGSGRGGRVTAGDVHAYKGDSIPRGATPIDTEGLVAAAEVADANEIMRVPLEYPAIPADGIRERIPFRGIRRKIAQALDLSVKTAVHFTVVEEVDVTALNAKRNEYARVLGRKLSLLPFVMSATCKALRQHPSLNANVDDANNEILIKEVVNLGCAVDTEHGLMVPTPARSWSSPMTSPRSPKAARTARSTANDSPVAPSRSPTSAPTAAASPRRSSTTRKWRFSPPAVPSRRSWSATAGSTPAWCFP